MKKHLAILFLAAGLLLGGAQQGQAVDFKARGVWINMLEYGGGGNFVKNDRNGHNVTGWGRWGEDEFEAKTRVRLQLEAIASESLSGTVYFEIGAATWGSASKGGALGADKNIVKIKHSYLDWVVPGTAVKARMGIQRIFLPDYASEASQVFDADVAGINVSAPLGEHAAVTAFWARPFNDNWSGGADGTTHYLDNVDVFGLLLPLTFEGVRLTPWAMLGMVGSNAFRSGNDYYGSGYGSGIGPSWYALPAHKADGTSANAYGTAFWAGLTGEITAADPFRLAWSVNYGTFDSGEEALNRSGWYASLLAEYKLDWGTPGIYAWYSSGDDDDPTNGSERLPSIAGAGNFTSFMGDGNLAWGTGYNFYDNNLTYAGTWGIGLRIHDLSFVEDLKHSFRVAYWGGTNSPAMAKYVNSSYGWQNFNADGYGEKDGPYLTTNDGLLEFNLVNSYQIYENLEANLELGYIVNLVDDDTWKRSYRSDSYKKQDAWKAQLIFAYSF